MRITCLTPAYLLYYMVSQLIIIMCYSNIQYDVLNSSHIFCVSLLKGLRPQDTSLILIQRLVTHVP